MLVFIYMLYLPNRFFFLSSNETTASFQDRIGACLQFRSFRKSFAFENLFLESIPRKIFEYLIMESCQRSFGGPNEQKDD